MPAIRFYYSDTIHDFLDRCTDEIIGKMVQASAHDLNDETTDSWVCEIEVLKDVLALYRDRGSFFDAMDREQTANGIDNVIEQIYKYAKK